MNTYINFLVTPPRKLQLNSIAERWHVLIAKTLNDTTENIQLVTLQNSYEIELTTQPNSIQAWS